MFRSRAARELAARFPEVEVQPVAADFTRPFEVPDPTTATRRRASSSRQDTALAFTEEEAGVYVAAAGELAPGSWVASVEATASGTDRQADGGREVLYRLKRRLWVK